MRIVTVCELVNNAGSENGLDDAAERNRHEHREAILDQHLPG